MRLSSMREILENTAIDHVYYRSYDPLVRCAGREYTPHRAAQIAMLVGGGRLQWTPDVAQAMYWPLNSRIELVWNLDDSGPAFATDAGVRKHASVSRNSDRLIDIEDILVHDRWVRPMHRFLLLPALVYDYATHQAGRMFCVVLPLLRTLLIFPAFASLRTSSVCGRANGRSSDLTKPASRRARSD